MTPIEKHAKELLDKLLSYAGEGVTTEGLFEKYGTLSDIASLPIERLTAEIGERGAEIIKLTAAIASRSVTDGFDFKKPTDKEIDEYFRALSLGKSVELVYVMSFDKGGRVIAVDEVAEGTVNSSEILPRRLLEIAYKRGAASVILAHNHPRGEAKASDADIEATATAARILYASRIELRRHIIVGGGETVSIGDIHKYIGVNP